MIIEQMQRFLIEPAEAIRDDAERRRVRLLSGLTLFVAGALLSGAIASSEGSLALGALLGVVAYSLSRTRHYQAAAIAAVIALQLPSIIFAYNAPTFTDANLYGAFIWFGIPLILTSLWLLPGLTIALTIVNIIMISIIPAIHPEVTNLSIIVLSAFIGTLGGLAALAAFIQQQNVRQIETQRRSLEKRTEELEAANILLDEARVKADEANRVKTEFLSTMSHELRTPLTAILGFSDLMLEGIRGEMTPSQRDTLRRIHRNGETLLMLVNDVLDLAKLEARKITVTPRPLDVTPFFTTLTEDVDSLKGDLTFTLSIADDMPVTITTDEHHLERIVTNLLSNAFKFTDEGSVTLDVYPLPGERWAVRVADTGIGIPPDQQRVIFAPFRQSDGSPTRQYGGTGLGLAIVKHLATVLGGRISLESEPGQGATFTVELPT